MNYNSMKDKLNINELAHFIVQVEVRVKQLGHYSANFVIKGDAKKKHYYDKMKGTGS